MKSKSRAAIWYLKDNTLGRFSQLFPYNDEELTSEQDIFDPQILLDREVPTKHKQLSFPHFTKKKKTFVSPKRSKLFII